EDRGLAGAVRSDQSVDASSSDLQVDVAYCDEALELLREVAGFEDVIGVHAAGRASLARATTDETPRPVARSPFEKGGFYGRTAPRWRLVSEKKDWGRRPSARWTGPGGWEEERTSRSADAAQRAGTRSRRSSRRRAREPGQIRLRLPRSSSRIRRSTSERL